MLAGPFSRSIVTGHDLCRTVTATWRLGRAWPSRGLEATPPGVNRLRAAPTTVGLAPTVVRLPPTVVGLAPTVVELAPPWHSGGTAVAAAASAAASSH
ncbi:unnamed protein product [Lampetra planeri]